MWRGHRAIGVRRCFPVPVIEIREVKPTLTRPNLHFFERIAQVSPAQLVQSDRLRIVRHYPNHSHASFLIIVYKLPDALLVILRRGAMVAGEDDEQNFGLGEVLQRIVASIYTG